jgi:4-amino-4-deoxy-L-arabinose transferase-like glycosyltransferase
MALGRISLIIAVMLFVGLAACQLSLPGLHYDEAFEVVPTVQLLLGQPVTTFRDNGLWLGGRLLPLMTQDYIGAINTYLALPFLLGLGINVVSLRLMAVCVGIVTLCLAYRLARELVGAPAGGVTALLLAVNPTFVFWSRQGVFVTSVTAAIGMAAALAGLRWWRTGARGYAVLAAFLFGVGVFAKLLFLWLIVGLMLAAALAMWLQAGCSVRDAWVILRIRVTAWGTVVWCVLAFAFGSAPLLAYNLQTGGTLQNVGTNLTTSYYGTNNLAFLANLVERVKQFGVVLTGGHLWYLGGSYSNWLNPALFLAALGLAVWLVGRGAQGSRRLLVPFVVVVGVIVASCVTVSALWVTHYAVLAPWPPLAIGCTVAFLARRARAPGNVWQTPRLTLAALALVGASWTADLVTGVRYQQALAVSGGLGAHSDAVYDLADWLSATARQRTDAGHGRLMVAAMDWGIAAPVTFLTRGGVTPIETFGYQWESDADLTKRLEQVVRQPDAIYLWRAPEEIVFDRSQEFKRVYRPLRLEEDIVAAFYERSGRPVLGATQLVPQGSAKNPPSPLDAP